MLKKIKLIAIINIFILSFISHYIYDLFPSILISFFFPVNESIAEHMKIIYTSTLVYGLFDYLLLKYNNIKFQNFRSKPFPNKYSFNSNIFNYLPSNIHFLW